MKFILFVLLLAAAGCALIPEDPLEDYSYSFFEGTQSMWAVKERDFAPTKIYGIDYYKNEEKPNRFYVVIARLSGVQSGNLTETRDRVAKYTARVGGDAFIEGTGVQESIPYSGEGMVIASGVNGFIVKYIPKDYGQASGLADVLAAWVWCGENENGAVYEGKTVTAAEIKIIKEQCLKQANNLIHEYWISIRDGFPRDKLTKL